MKTFVVTATHNGSKIRRFGSWELQSTSKEDAEKEIREVEGEDKNWPPGTSWETKEKS